MASTGFPLPELKFLAPQITPKRRVSHSGFCACRYVSRNSRCNVALRMRIRAAKEEGALVEAERVSDVEWSGNGVAANVGGGNGSVNGYVNGSLGVVESGNGVSNGSLVKYVNGNGVAAEVVVDSAEASKRKEDGRKKRLEEIGKEDAWFKQSKPQNGKEQAEVLLCIVD